MERISTIGRPVDPRYPTNLAIAVLTGLVFVAGFLWQDWRWGGAAAIGFFFAWALGRELDPDREYAAFVAAGLALAGMAIWGLPGLLIHVWIMLALRLVNRTPGPPATLLDALALAGISGWLIFQGNFAVAVVTALAFMLDARWDRSRRVYLWFAAALAAFALVIFFSGNGADGGRLTLPFTWPLLLITLLQLPVIVRARDVETVGDLTGERLAGRRVQAGVLLALLGGWLTAVFLGDPGVIGLLPLWAALLGVAVYQVGEMVLGIGE